MPARILLATDMDRTLLPNGAQPESPGARGLFAAVAARPEVVLAYVTGRHRALVEAAIAEYGLPEPDYVIGDVGTTLYRIDGEGWHEQPDWAAAIGRDWSGRTVGELAAALTPIAELRLQEGGKQNTWKLSYYTPVLADPAPLLASARARLAALGVRANLIWSIDEAADVGLLDVLPASASKLQALEFLARQLDLPYRQALFAGDSGNDLEALTGPIPAVLVANADETVRRQVLDLARRQGHPELLYLARGGWAGLNGNYSAGILEGLAHFMPQTRDWMPGLENRS
ncbi:MAG: HAD-IIB family hydrolase [Gallionellaceae bacterium]|nr:HAD-IIB family hydrolase [Gallionellaceae bacterium]